jgi:hypothetical protein
MAPLDFFLENAFYIVGGIFSGGGFYIWVRQNIKEIKKDIKEADKRFEEKFKELKCLQDYQNKQELINQDYRNAISNINTAILAVNQHQNTTDTAMVENRKMFNEIIVSIARIETELKSMRDKK